MKKLSVIILIPLMLFVFTALGQTTISYNLKDQSTFTNTGVQWDPVTSTTSPDGKMRTQASTTQWHSSGYGIVFKSGNSLEIDVPEGQNTIRFYGSVYSAGTMTGGTTIGGSELGEKDVDLDNHSGMADKTGYYEFSYTGGAITLYFTFSGSNAYTPAIDVTNLVVAIAKTDVWDFGAQQLDNVLYNNMLTETKINAWYGTTTPGTTGVVLPSFTEGILGFVSGSNDRLRTTNTNLTRYDTNIASSATYTGRVYVNSNGATSRFLTLNLNEDDEVTIATRTDAGGSLNFQYFPNPAAQTDVVSVPAAETLLKFVAKSAGEYRVFDTAGKPSYFRVYRKAANYKTISGTIDESLAPSIPNGYTLNFTNQAGKTFSTVVSSGTYSINLPAEYSYDLSLGGANGYVISNGLSLNVTDSSTTHDVTVIQVDLYTVSGNITGLSDLTNLVLHFTPDPAENKVYIPIISIDKSASTYNVNLEAGVEYTITADNVNDFEILTNTLTIGTANQTANIDFTLKPIYNVTINTSGLDATQKSALSLTFTNKNETNYSYNFTDVTAVALRNGVYTLAYSGLDTYPIELALTSNLTISGANTTKDLSFIPIREWVFKDRNISNATAYKGLAFTGSVNVRGSSGDLLASSGATISIPVKVGDKVQITDYYQSNYSIEGGAPIQNTSNSTSTKITTEHIYTGTTDGTVTITTAGTSYFVSIKVLEVVTFTPVITVGTDKDYQTINSALNAIALMNRPNNERVTVSIDPGNYEEMLVISSPNVTLKNAASSPSIAILNAGVNIDANAVRITSYYGQKYNFFSQGTDNKWHADVLAVNKDNGYTTYVNQEGSGNGSSYWNATVVVAANGFTAEDIILENSFNQYISLKESQDVVQPKASDPVRPTNYGNTSVQNRAAGYVTQAAAIGIANNTDKVLLNNCRVIGRQDSFYGGAGSRVVVYKGAMMGAVDYIFGGMTAVFYKTDFVLNTSDSSSDAAYITAAQQTSGRGFLMYECHVKSPIPGIETASVNGSKPGYFGRPWAPTTSEVIFYNTTIDESTYPGSEGFSLISPVGWTSSLGGESNKMYEFGTIENASGVNNSGNRASWSTVLNSPTLTHDGTSITTFNFTKGNDNWDPISQLNSLAVNDVHKSTSKVNIAAYNGKVYISNVKTTAQINIYNITGALIKSLKTKTDTDFNFEKGLYIMTVNDADGQKAFKLLTH